MLELQCFRCNKELDKPGGLLFGPTKEDPIYGELTSKIHLCAACYIRVLGLILDER